MRDWGEHDWFPFTRADHHRHSKYSCYWHGGTRALLVTTMRTTWNMVSNWQRLWYLSFVSRFTRLVWEIGVARRGVAAWPIMANKKEERYGREWMRVQCVYIMDYATGNRAEQTGGRGDERRKMLRASCAICVLQTRSICDQREREGQSEKRSVPFLISVVHTYNSYAYHTFVVASFFLFFFCCSHYKYCCWFHR